MTVSHALNGRKQYMSADTYERVLRSVQELKYVPVRPARQNRHVETRAVGVVPFHADLSRTVLDSQTYGGLCEGARKHGYDVLVMLRDDSDWMINRQDVRFLDRRSDGFIFMGGGFGEWQEAFQVLADNAIPTVACYRRDVPPEIAWVDPDNEGIICQALDCLKRHGHRRIAYLGAPVIDPVQAGRDPNWLVSRCSPHFSYDDVERRALFNSIMEQDEHWEHHLILDAADSHWNVLPEVLRQLQEQEITGVVCVSDFIGLQFLDLLEANGLRAPEDMSVIGIDDFPEAAGRQLTSIAFGYREIGRQAMDIWIELRAGKTPAECSRVVPAHLIERSSVGPPR